MSEKKGPTIKISCSCFGCIYCKSEKYHFQGDSGTDVFCEHPDFDVRKTIGDTTWNTPSFCPYKKEALFELINNL